MKTSERKHFADALTQLYAVYGAELTERVLDAWWGVLSPYRLHAVLAAMNLHAADTERGMFRPTPADVRRHLEITLPRMMHERRAVIARQARDEIAPLRERLELARNDLRLGLLHEQDVERIAENVNAEIEAIMRRAGVRDALSPKAVIRDEDERIGPRDRLPDIVRKALGWLGGRHHAGK